MTDIIAALAALTDEEQRINAQDWREPRDFNRLARIGRARALLLDVHRAIKAGASLADVPLDGYAVDRVGFSFARPRQRPIAPLTPSQRGGARGGPRDLPTGVERIQSGRVRAVVFLRDRTKISLGTFEATPEQIALAGRMAEAGRAARDRGGGAGDVRAAAFAIYQEEQRHADA